MRKFLCFVVFLLLFQVNNAQTIVKGQLVDSKTHKPVSFAALVPNNYPQYGTVSDIDGYYRLEIPKQAETVHISHICYYLKEIAVATFIKKNEIELEPTVFEINEVLVNAKENPAYRIIRQAAKNKKQNNPDNYSYYSCEIYQKTTAGPSLNDTVKVDSTNQRLKNISDSLYIYLMESHSIKYYEKDKGSKELVEAVRVSGFKKPEFFMSNNEIQPFHFYNEYINLYENLFLSPISNQAIGKYYFEIIDTVIHASDTIFSIFYRPYKNKAFDGLTGQLQINTNGFAIQNIYAQPAGHHLLKIKVHQQYQFVNQHWFPEEIDYDLETLTPKMPGLMLHMSGRSKMHNPVFTTDERPSIRIDNIAYEFTPRAWSRDSTYWNTIRTDSLSVKEIHTYHVIDSVFEDKKVEFKMKWGFRIARTSKIPIKYVSIDHRQIFNYNLHEGVQLGFGLYTNDDISKYFVLGGYFRYGFKDERFKYGGSLKLELNREKRFELGGGYSNDLTEPGYNNFDKLEARLFSRSLVMNRTDSVNNTFVSVQRQFGKWLFGVKGQQQFITPLYAYRFLSDSNLSTFTNNQINVSIRFAPNERVNYIFGYPFAIFAYPIFNLQYIYGFKNAVGKGFEYHKILFSAMHDFKITGWGESKVQLKMGYINNNVPLFALIEGEGSYDENLPFIFNGFYQVVKPGEFFNNRFVGLFYSHNFGPIFKITEKVKPGLILTHNMGFGQLYHADLHEFVDLKSMEKGYFESGVILNNLFRQNIYNFAYVGLGVGVFYRYGEYAYLKQISNFAFKLSLSFTW